MAPQNVKTPATRRNAGSGRRNELLGGGLTASNSTATRSLQSVADRRLYRLRPVSRDPADGELVDPRYPAWWATIVRLTDGQRRVIFRYGRWSAGPPRDRDSVLHAIWLEGDRAAARAPDDPGWLLDFLRGVVLPARPRR